MKNLKKFDEINEHWSNAKTPEVEAKAKEWMSKQKSYDKAFDSRYGFVQGYQQALEEVRLLLKDNKDAQDALINAKMIVGKVKK
jgi:hypothetical protein